jgi:hypothetical protein
MPQTTFVVDQAATFMGLVLISCEPRTGFRSDKQETTKDGVPRWTCELLAGFRDNFGKTQNEVIKVTVDNHRNPGEGYAPFTPVQLSNFVVGVMEDRKRNREGQEEIVGVRVWYRADDMRPIAAVPNGTPSGRRSSATSEG